MADSRVTVIFSREAENNYRELALAEATRCYLPIVRKIVSEQIQKNPENERNRLIAKLECAYRIKQEGVVIGYLVRNSRVEIVCISLVPVNATDGLQLLNNLMSSGIHDPLLIELGFSDALLRTRILPAATEQ